LILPEADRQFWNGEDYSLKKGGVSRSLGTSPFFVWYIYKFYIFM